MKTLHYLRKYTLTAALATLAITQAAQAQTSWSTGANGHWSMAGNWISGVPNANAASILPGDTDYAVIYDSSDVAGFHAFTGLNLGASGSTHTATLQIGATGFTYSADSAISQNGVLEILSGGVLTQTNSTTNGTRILSGGSLIVRSGGLAKIRGGAPTNTGSFVVESGGELQISGGNLNLGGGATFDNQGTFKMTAGVPINLIDGASLSNSGTLIAPNSTQNVFIVGNNATATLTLTAGSVTTGVALWDRGFVIGQRGSVASNGINQSTTTQTGGDTLNKGVLLIGVTASQASAPTDVRIGADASLDISGGTWVNGQAAQASEFLESVIVGANLTRWSNAAGSVDNAIAGPLEGKITLSNTGSFQSYGNVYLGAGGGKGTLEIIGGSVAIANSGNAVLKLGAAGTELGDTASSVDKSKGAITTIGDGTLNISGGSLTVDKLQATAGHSAILFSAGAMAISTSAQVDTSGGLTVGDGSGGAGTLDLTSSVGTYNFTHGLNIENGSTLRSVGTIGGIVKVFDGGKLSIGTVGSIGTTAFLDGLTLNGGSASFFDINSTSGFDLATGSTVRFGGTLNLAFAGAGYAVGDSFKLFDFSGSYLGDFSVLHWTGLDSGLEVTFNSNSGIAQLRAIPEPSQFALLFFGASGLILLQHRRSPGGRGKERTKRCFRLVTNS